MFGATKIEMEILSQLRSSAKMYGLEMVKASGGILKRGTVYVYLARMQDKEWVKSVAEKEPSVLGAARRAYSITDKGQIVFDRARALETQFSEWGDKLPAV